ncbi:MAG: flagellar hook-length control protein FliK [Betaproteobacteria bacterium]|nr:flagellar hook-length control protein FliK [Betaproteobacteria bacterium]
MPEMTALPNPALAPAPVSTPRASGGAATPANTASSAPSPATSAPNAPGATGGPNAPNTPQATANPADAGDAPDSFASVLQRQIAQAALADQAKAGIALPSDLAAQSRPAGSLLADLALQSANAGAGKSDPDAKSKNLTGQETPDDGLAGLSAYLLSLSQNTPVKLDAGLPATDKKSSAAPTGDALLAAASLALASTHLSSAKDKDAPQAAISGASQETATKTAEFAALLTTSAETAPALTRHGGLSAGGEAGFENLLAAQQAIQNRGVEAHPANHATTALPIQTPVGANGWDGEVGDKLVWMVGRQQQRAELVLNPPQLGRVEVSLSMHGDQTSAMFVSTNPAVRDALEAALPRLREMLADAGINLGQAQVGADTGSNNAANQSAGNRENRDNSGRDSSGNNFAQAGEPLRPVVATQWLKQANGMVDVFA